MKMKRRKVESNNSYKSGEIREIVVLKPIIEQHNIEKIKNDGLILNPSISGSVWRAGLTVRLVETILIQIIIFLDDIFARIAFRARIFVMKD